MPESMECSHIGPCCPSIVSEEQCLYQIYLDELYGGLQKPNEEEKKKYAFLLVLLSSPRHEAQLVFIRSGLFLVHLISCCSADWLKKEPLSVTLMKTGLCLNPNLSRTKMKTTRRTASPRRTRASQISVRMCFCRDIVDLGQQLGDVDASMFVLCPDVEVDVDELNQEQVLDVNKMATSYGMAEGDFVR